VIVVADYGVGNLQSIIRMLRKAGANAQLSSSPDDIRCAEKIILPGVGNFGHCARQLRATALFDALQWFALDARRPVLGICVGGQLLGHSSEEAPGVPGLGWIEMECRRFPTQAGYRVPNMGWNAISQQADASLFKYNNNESRFYFVHSYYMNCHDPELPIATAYYGFPYTCAVRKSNIQGVQFHPEKSLRHGLNVLKAFAEM
jgi:imidazole glycerol-phosphate synthase subunit HisH